ncbi:MAG: FoF1 ATP synthase subunit gamma [Hydrogenobacter sp.]
MRVKDLDDKVNYLNSIKKYINAMNLLSLNRYRKYYAEVSAQHVYFLRLEEVLGMLTHLYKGGVLGRKEKTLCLVVFTTDRGFVGKFNEHLLEKVHAFLENPPLKVRKLIVIGKRGAELLGKDERTETYTDVFRKDIDWQVAQEAFHSIVEGYMTKLYDSVYIAFNRPLIRDILTKEEKERVQIKRERIELTYTFYELFKKAPVTLPIALGRIASYQPQIVKFIPPEIKGVYTGESVVNFEGDEEYILEQILRLYLNFLFRELFLEHFTAELSARFIKTREIMKNIDSKRMELSLKRNRLRQERINRELLDIINTCISMEGRLFKDIVEDTYVLEVDDNFEDRFINLLFDSLRRKLNIKGIRKKKNMLGFRVLSNKKMYDFTLEGFFAHLLGSLPYPNL